MIIGSFSLKPDVDGWVVRRLAPDSDGRLAPIGRPMYPGTYPQALRRILDESVRDGAPDIGTLAEAVATVAHLYATIGGEQAAKIQRRKSEIETRRHQLEGETGAKGPKRHRRPE